MSKGSYAILAIAILGLGLAWTSTIVPFHESDDAPGTTPAANPHEVDWSQPFDWTKAPAIERTKQESAAKTVLALKDAAKKVDVQRQKSLCRQLARYGAGLFPVLVHEWQETNIMFRAGLIETTRQIRGEYAARFINEMFRYPHERNIGDAINALGDFNDGWGASLLCHLYPNYADPEIKSLLHSNLLRCARSEDIPLLEKLRRLLNEPDRTDIQSLIGQVSSRAGQKSVIESIQELPNNQSESLERLKALWREQSDSGIHVAIINKLFDLSPGIAEPWIKELATATSADLSYDFRVIARQLSLAEGHVNTLEQLCLKLNVDAVIHLLDMLNNNGKAIHIPLLERLALEHTDNRVRNKASSVCAAIQKRAK